MELRYNFEIVGDILDKKDIVELKDIYNESETEQEFRNRSQNFIKNQFKKLDLNKHIEELQDMFGEKLVEEITKFIDNEQLASDR